MAEEEKVPFRGTIQKFKPHPLSKIGKTIAVISGKGGVGKSMVTSLLATVLQNEGKKVAILDADVTGPSIPKAFGQEDYKVMGSEDSLIPAQTDKGMLLISANNLLEDVTSPLIWRGPMIASLVQQLYTQTVFGEVDYLLIDMPPGTGDVPLTIFQSVAVDAVVVVSSPQDLVEEVVAKSVNMAKTMNIKILGLVENMAYLKCPHCAKRIDLYGPNKGADVASRYNIPFLDELPLDSALTALVDEGKIEDYSGPYLKGAKEAAKAL